MEEQYNDIKKIVKEAGLEQPSPIFLTEVMKKIEVISEQKPIVYHPLIAKRTWLVIASVILGIIVYVLFFSANSVSMFDKMNLSFFNVKSFQNPLKEIALYKTSVYGVLFFAVLFLFQITILKRRIDKRFSL